MEIEKIGQNSYIDISVEAMGIKSGGDATIDAQTKTSGIVDNLNSVDDDAVLDTNVAQNTTKVTLQAEKAPATTNKSINTSYETTLNKRNAIVMQINKANNKIEILENNLEKARENSDKKTISTLEQQLLAQKSFVALREAEVVILDNSTKQLEECSITAQKYSNNSTIQGMLSDKVKLVNQLHELATKKSTAMQAEDKKQQYAIYKKLKEINVKLAKATAKADGRTISNTEISLVEQKSDKDYQSSRIKEKQAYLNHKLSDIQQQKATAIQNKDSEALYVLKQQENAIKNMFNIFQNDLTNLQEKQSSVNESLELVQKYPNNSQIEKLVKNKAELEFELVLLSQQKSTAMQAEDKEAQYILEQQENSLWEKLKEITINLTKEQAKAEGKTLSDTEIDLISQNADSDFKNNRIQEKMSYLDYKLANISQQKVTAMQAGDKEQAYILEQQENAIKNMINIFQEDLTNLQEKQSSVNESLELVRQYPNNSQIEKLIKNKAELEFELVTLSQQKSNAMQVEDKYQQYLIEQEENKIIEKITNIDIQIEKAKAKADGRTFSATEETMIKNVAELKFRLNRVIEKRSYLDNKLINIAQQKSTAIQAEDKHAQYILEQQENAIKALDTIFEMEQTTIEKSLADFEGILSAIQQYPNNKEIQNIAKKMWTLAEQSIEIAQQKSTAMQTEDQELIKTLAVKEKNMYEQEKELQVQLNQQIAKEQGKTLSQKQLANMRKGIDKENDKYKAMEIKQYLMYKLIGIASLKADAMQAKDKQARYNLEQQEHKINNILKFSDEELLERYGINFLNKINTELNKFIKN